ncbi:hypothetical protein PYW08_015807 [Mythimna loreyi]|uniref:Uncharacterized protein n=1 Tax=Mythimna loreyi TaxID=667449 RepID=A0ACC2QWU6_9NEOP|nr:hypothetical protein PYW08_015807 [Mythimna loreyi]
MKFPLLVVLSFIIVLLLNQSESRIQFSVPHTFNFTFEIGDNQQESDENTSTFSEIFSKAFQTRKDGEGYLLEDIIHKIIGSEESKEYNLNEDIINLVSSTTTPHPLVQHGYPAEFHTVITDDKLVQEESKEYAHPNEDLIKLMSSMTTPQPLVQHGYPAESHTVVTDDNIVPEESKEYAHPNEDPIILMASMTTPQLIALHGYPSESHTIVTDDGYILTIHRIPYSRTSKDKTSPKKTVLLHHGLFGSSAHWIITGPTKSLGYILSDAGYDVWMANVRGNTYSRAHVSKDVNSREFWNFSFHEVSQHDLPAVIDYITEVKGSDVKIDYIGHSMGTTVLFAMLSTKTQYNKVLRAGFALAPVAYMTNIESTFKNLAKYSNIIEYLLEILGGDKEVLPHNPQVKWLSKNSHELMNLDVEELFEGSLSFLLGRCNKTLMPLFLSHIIAGASTKTLVHYAQEIQQNGKFQMFDYGEAHNLKEYGTVSPPQYPLYKITLPIALFSAESDSLSTVVDASQLLKQLVNPIEHYIVPLTEFGHGDFLFANDAPTLVYARLLQLLENGVSDQNFKK